MELWEEHDLQGNTNIFLQACPLLPILKPIYDYLKQTSSLEKDAPRGVNPDCCMALWEWGLEWLWAHYSVNIPAHLDVPVTA